MKFITLALLVFILSLPSYARICNAPRKGVTAPVPAYPANVFRGEGWNEAYNDMFNVLCKNLKTPNFFFRGYRSHPGPPYKAAYLWDTAFISLVWMHWDPRIAQELIRYLLRFQRSNGLIHHAVLEILLKPYAYSESQPPLLSWASWQIYEKSHDKQFLQDIYPGLRRYHQWLVASRRHPDGLYFWAKPYESGIDNSPRFASRDEHSMDDTRQMAAVDMSSYMALSMESLAKMAFELGLYADQAEYLAQYDELKIKVNTLLWDEVDGTYYDWDYRTKKFIRISTISNFTPLIAGIPSDAQAKSLVREIMDEQRYNTKVPFPSVARNEPIFTKDMWRGPVWINMAYLGVKGMDRYGYHDESVLLSKKIVAGVYETWKNTGRFYEFYDSDRYDIKELHRKKGNLWKKITLGSKPVKDFVGWTGLANTLVIEYGPEW